MANWPLAEHERANGEMFNLKGERQPTTPAQRGLPQLHESEKELAEQGDHVATHTPGTLGALIRGGRGAGGCASRLAT